MKTIIVFICIALYFVIGAAIGATERRELEERSGEKTTFWLIPFYAVLWLPFMLYIIVLAFVDIITHN